MSEDRYKYFRIEAAELLDKMSKALLDLERGAAITDHLPALLRYTHTLKGAARVVRQTEIAEIAHAMESVLTPYRGGTTALSADASEQLLRHIDAIAAHAKQLAAPPTAQADAASTTARRTTGGEVKDNGARVDAPTTETPSTPAPWIARAEASDVEALLENIDSSVASLGLMRPAIAQIGEIRALAEVLGRQAMQSQRSRSQPLASNADTDTADALQRALRALDQQLQGHVERIGRELGDLRAAAEALRLVPASNVFTTVERALRDACHEVGKRAQLVTRGGDARLDGHAMAVIQGALTQLVRNAMAHGIETPAERERAGKPASGQVTLDVTRRGQRVLFVCEDDGRGLDEASVRKALAARGSQGADPNTLDAAALLSLLPHAGISTASQVSSIAGRGVGLDLVREAAQQLGGELRLSSVPGRSFRAELEVPLSIAAFEALRLEDGAAVAAVPASSVVRCARAEDDSIATSADGYRVRHEDTWVPLIPLSALWGDTETSAEQLRVFVVVSTERSMIALGAKRLLGIRTAIMRPLPTGSAALPCVAGTYVNAFGHPEIVIDPERLIDHTHVTPRASVVTTTRKRILIVDDSLTTRMMEQSILESAGYDVDLAVSAEDGFEQAPSGGYSLFLVDVEMPGANGFEFVERTRADPRTRHIPAVLVSSLNAPEDFARGAQAGAAGYVVKSSFDQRQLLALIERLVRST